MQHSHPVLAHRDVIAALDAIRRAAEATGRTAAIAIADAHRELVAFVRCDFGGRLPVRIDGIVAGAVGVSGLSDDEDEPLAALGVALLEGMTPASISA